jgi:hypothetical protein
MVLEQLHNSPTAGHLGVKKTSEKVRKRFYWYRMRKDVQHWIRVCDGCASKKRPFKKFKAPLQLYNVGEPMERIAIDIMGPFPRSTRGNKYIMVVGDYFTRWLQAIPLKDQEAVTVADALIEKMISLFGVPLELHTDQGTNFESQLFKETCELLGIRKTRTTAFRPQSDGMIERANQTIKGMLRAYVSANQKDWDKYVPLVMMAYRSAVHEFTGVSPCEMMLGRDIALPIDISLGRPEKESKIPGSDYAYDLAAHMSQIHPLVREHVILASDSMKRNYDQKKHLKVYTRGDAVWLHNNIYKKGVSPKLQSHWQGPYLVTHQLSDVTYRIQESPRSKPRVVHHDRLKPYQGEHKPT